MPCYHPIKGYRNKKPNPSGKFGFTNNPQKGNSAFPMTVPCGYCIGCRLEKSRQWAMRCIHEASLHKKNCWITLTFNEEALEKRKTNSLRKRDFQLFMKRLRKIAKTKIRYYQCGEYGEQNGRPHYHACIFGYDFDDKINNRSLTLKKIWPHGHHYIGQLNFETAAYTARYIIKKNYGESAKKHYEKVNTKTGEIENILPEYTTMSRRPGIGNQWLTKYKKDIYPKDSLHVRGHKCRPAKYYDRIIEKLDPETHAKIKLSRKIKQIKKALDKNQPTLESQERVMKSKLKLKNRSIERA